MTKELKKNRLGNSGLMVTEFCLGVLPMGPLQARAPMDLCVHIIRKALDMGVNFFDTAQMYETESYLGTALKGKREQAVITSKSTAPDYDGMAASVANSLRELDTDYIDIYLLHAARPGVEVFRERKGALDCLVEKKKAGVIKAAGISTHNPSVVAAAAERDDIDIIFPLINMTGMGLIDGSINDMLRAIAKAHSHGKGVYAMKALAGGNLISNLEEALNWVRAIEGVSSIAVGVVSEEELLDDLRIFGLDTGIKSEFRMRTKKLYVMENLCKGCGICVETCPNQALFMEGEKAKVDQEKCLLCGYCSPSCPNFIIRII